MRIKNKKEATRFGVADGLDFNTETNVSGQIVSEPMPIQTTDTRTVPVRSYSKYYTPKPKKGSKGSTLGRGSIDEKERKVQFSLTCTSAQKERFQKAAKKAQRKLPEFICIAVEEYIEKNNLF